METKQLAAAILRTTETAWGRYDVIAERATGRNARHPVTGQDLGPSFDRLTRCLESRVPNGKRRVDWHVGYGIGSDGGAYSGGMRFKTKREALRVWNQR
jgi:hypothetical protein